MIDLILITEQLQLRPCSIQELTSLHMLWTGDRVRYFLFDDRTITVDEARSFIETSVDSFKQKHYGLWTVWSQAQCIGFAGLLSTEEDPHLIYGFHPNAWGQGYATEAARAVLEYGLKTLMLPKIAADVDEPNIASVRVLQKIGMQSVRRAIVNDRLLLYFIT